RRDRSAAANRLRKIRRRQHPQRTRGRRMSRAAVVSTAVASRDESFRSRIWSLQHRFAPYLFVLPFVLLFSIFICYPLVRSLILSTYKTVGPRHEIFAGLDNYRFVLGDRVFWLAVANTVTYTIAFLCVQIPLALGLALLLNS